MKWLLIIIVALVAVAALLYGAGLVLPREHRAASRIRLAQPADSVWQVMRDLARHAEWWGEVRTVERGDSSDGRERWRETLDGGWAMTMVVEELEPGRRFRTVIEPEPGSPFGGSWTYEVVPDGAGALVTVTEDGWIGNPFFRVISYVTGYHRTLDSFLKALGQRFGESPAPLHVS